MMKHKRGITLVEVSICVFLGAIIFTLLMKLLTSGMQGSTKGIAHQANMETASIIMSQIEYDLLRASSIESPQNNETDVTAKWSFYYAASGSGKPVTVTYAANPSGGIERKVDVEGKIQNTTLGKDHEVSLSFTHFQTTPVPKAYAELGAKYIIRDAMWVEVTVSTKHDKKVGARESISLKRLVVVRNNAN